MEWLLPLKPFREFTSKDYEVILESLFFKLLHQKSSGWNPLSLIPTDQDYVIVLLADEPLYEFSLLELKFF